MCYQPVLERILPGLRQVDVLRPCWNLGGIPAFEAVEILVLACSV